MAKQLYRQLTEYEETYSNCYWGQFTYDPRRDDSISHIFDNRNKFITDYDIKLKQSRLDKFKYFMHLIRCFMTDDFFDHLECYKTNDKKLIFIISPYTNYDRIKDKMEAMEITHIYPLYSNSATTWMKQFDTVTDVLVWISKHFMVELTIHTNAKDEHTCEKKIMSIHDAKKFIIENKTKEKKFYMSNDCHNYRRELFDLLKKKF